MIDNLQQRLLEALQAAIENDAIKTITVPFPGLDVEESKAWALAGRAARAIKEIDGKLNSVNKVALERVTFILFADVLCTVLRQHLQVKQEIEPPALPLTTGKVKLEPQRDSYSPQPNQGQTISDQTNDGWCTIERLLRQRKHISKTQYLFKWEGHDVPSWVDRADVTDFAIQTYLAAKRHRRRRKAR